MIRKTFTAALAAASFFALASAALAGETVKLELTITNLKPEGELHIAAFESAEAWNGGAPAAGAMPEVKSDTVKVSMKDLKPGRYAIRLFQDLNGDGEMNTNPFGIPTEPYAFSNGAVAQFGPPSFEQAAFDVGPGDTEHTIKMEDW